MAEANSPQWWIERLSLRLQYKRGEYEKLGKYARGDHPLPEGDERARDMFKAFQRKARTNYCGLVVSCVNERLRVDGFRAGGSEDVSVDDRAWMLWQDNHLDADSEQVHEAALTYGESFVIVGLDENGPVITAEDPRTIEVELDPANRRGIRAGVKIWDDDVAQQHRAVLYLPESVHYFAAPKAVTPYKETIIPLTAVIAWEQTDDSFRPDSTVAGYINELGRVPIVRFVNKPRLSGKGSSEFADCLDVQDRINSVVLDRLVIAKMQAYRQRYIVGMPSEDENGNPVDLPFVPGVDLLWAIDSDPSELQIGEFAQVDLRPLLEAARDDVKAMVTLSGLPPHYVAGDLVNASADALAAAEARLVSKVRARQRTFAESWETVLELAGQWVGEDFPPDTEIVWADPERKTDSQLADAAVKKQAAGVPWNQLMEDLHYSPSQIQRMEVDRATDALLGPMGDVTPAAPPQETPRREPELDGDAGIPGPR